VEVVNDLPHWCSHRCRLNPALNGPTSCVYLVIDEARAELAGGWREGRFWFFFFKKAGRAVGPAARRAFHGSRRTSTSARASCQHTWGPVQNSGHRGRYRRSVVAAGMRRSSNATWLPPARIFRFGAAQLPRHGTAASHHSASVARLTVIPGTLISEGRCGYAARKTRPLAQRHESDSDWATHIRGSLRQPAQRAWAVSASIGNSGGRTA